MWSSLIDAEWAGATAVSISHAKPEKTQRGREGRWIHPLLPAFLRRLCSAWFNKPDSLRLLTLFKKASLLVAFSTWVAERLKYSPSLCVTPPPPAPCLPAIFAFNLAIFWHWFTPQHERNRTVTFSKASGLFLPQKRLGKSQNAYYPMILIRDVRDFLRRHTSSVFFALWTSLSLSLVSITLFSSSEKTPGFTRIHMSRPQAGPKSQTLPVLLRGSRWTHSEAIKCRFSSYLLSFPAHCLSASWRYGHTYPDKFCLPNWCQRRRWWGSWRGRTRFVSSQRTRDEERVRDWVYAAANSSNIFKCQYHYITCCLSQRIDIL